MDISDKNTEECYIMDRGSNSLNEVLMMHLFHSDTQFSLHKTLIDELDWSGVDYLWIIVMFLSVVWTLILTAPIHCRGSIGEQVM